MAKGKKKKKKGRAKRPAPARPPSSPRLQGPPTPQEAPEDTAGVGPSPSGPPREKPKSKERERREILDRRREAARRRRRIRNTIIGVLVIALIVGAVAFRLGMQRRALASHNALAAEAAGCEPVEAHGTQSREHVSVGRPITYETSPPIGGPHRGQSVLPARVYDAPLSDDPNAPAGTTIYDAVHSLEHGYVIIWHHGLEDAEERALTREFGSEPKVIVVPYLELEEREERVVLTAWARSQACSDADVSVVRSFVDLFREATTAPEPDAQ